MTLLAKRDGSVIRFSLKQGVGTRVGKSPWKVSELELCSLNERRAETSSRDFT